MRKIIQSIFSTVISVAILFTAYPAFAKNVSVVTVLPPSDGGKYITRYQSFTLPQWSYNFGMTFDYAFEPLEYADPTGARRRGIIDDLLMMNLQAALGLTDWWSAGVNMPMAIWETYYNPNMPAATVQKETLSGKMGDLRFEMKFRFLDIERYHIGLSLVPFIYFPTGKSSTFLGNGMWSPGALVVFDADIKNRVFMTMNVGYRSYNNTRYDTNNTNAVIDDTLMLGGGINVRITDSWAGIGEIWSESVIKSLFKSQLQSPTQFLAGGRFSPQGVVTGLNITAAGGRGITNGAGCPDWRVLVGVNYRHEYKPPPPPPVTVEVGLEEKIVITQKIHFEFGKSVIRPISYPILDDVASLLKGNPLIQHVRVEGHTDWIGSDASNLKLSQRRANAVRDYLITKGGIEPSRLEAVGYGETMPIADNNTVQGRARNRRTDFTVTK